MSCGHTDTPPLVAAAILFTTRVNTSVINLLRLGLPRYGGASKCLINVFVRREPLNIGLYGLGSRDRIVWGMTLYRPHSLADIAVTEADPIRLGIIVRRMYSYRCCLPALFCGFLEAVVSLVSVYTVATLRDILLARKYPKTC